MSADESLLERVASAIRATSAEPGAGVQSLITVTAGYYGIRPGDPDLTEPDGFDPAAAALFEAVVEAAFLVANADGEFDSAEKSAFRAVVLAACGERVGPLQMSGLMADLEVILREDGLDRRIEAVARSVLRSEHAFELMRIAALIAAVSAGVSAVEREVLGRLAAAFGLPPDTVDRAVAAAQSAVGVIPAAALG